LTANEVRVVSLTVVRTEAEAAVVCGMLRANGIPCSYRQTSFGAAAMDGMRGGQQAVLVSEENADRARALLDGGGTQRD
jgi:hypothetical protein